MREKLNKPVQKLLRRITNSITSSPTKLLHLPRKMAGLGIKYPTDIITTTKMSIIHRAQLQSDDATNIAAGLLMRPQRHQQLHWGQFQGGPLHFPTADTPICWVLSLLQRLDEIGKEISLTPTPLSETPPMIHSITENLDDIATEQQGLLTVIGIEIIEDL